MSAISSWSTSAASNNSASPDGFPENMAPSGVNNSSREVMASVRTWYQDYEWRNWGHVVTRTGNTTFTVPTDVTAVYTANRPIRCTDSSTLYGYIVSSVFGAVTTVTVALDSGNLSASLSAVAVGFLPSNRPISIQTIRIPGSSLYPGEWTTFTPTVTLVGGAGNTVPVYSTNSGRYTRIGNVVYGTVVLSGDGGAEGAGTGVFNIALPVTASANALQIFQFMGRGVNNATEYQLLGIIDPSATTINFRYYSSVTAIASFTGADQNNATRQISINFWYEV